MTLKIAMLIGLLGASHVCIAQQEGNEENNQKKTDKLSYTFGPGFLFNYTENDNMFSHTSLSATLNLNLDYRTGYHFENGIGLNIIIPAYTVESFVDRNYMKDQGYPLIYINTNPDSYPEDEDYYPYPYDDGNFYYQRQYGEVKFLPSIMVNWHFRLYFQEFNTRYTNFYFGGKANGLVRNIRLIKKTDIITRLVSGNGEEGDFLSEVLKKRIIVLSLIPEIELGVMFPMSYTALLDISFSAGGNLHNAIGQFNIGFRF